MPSLSEKRPPQGQAVIAEAAQLLRRMQFSHHHGAYAEGRHVAVSVDPRWNTDEDTFRVLISCTAFGRRRVDWARLPIQIAPDSGKGSGGVHALARLNPHGQTLIPSLPPGAYRLSLRVKPARVTSVLSHVSERLAAQGEEKEESRVWRGESEDGSLLWSLEETEEGDVQIAFETRGESLAGHVVVFSLIDPSNKNVLYNRRLSLQPARTPGKWEAWCSLGSRAEFQGPYELDFEVVSPDEV